MKPWFEELNAPPPATYLCEASAIGVAEVKEFRFGADSPYAFRLFIYNDAGTLRAYRDACPHFNVPLNYVEGDVFTPDRSRFLCMTHYAKFALHDGSCTEGPCEGQGLRQIPLMRDGERVLVGR